MSSFDLIQADAIPAAQLHQAFSLAFSDYLIGPFALSLPQWPMFLARQGVDLALSRIAMQDGQLRAFAFVAVRPALARWRLATMGSPPAQRGGGSAQVLLDDFMARAASAGMRAVELECFAQNERALRLYRSRGFEALHPLWGYQREPGSALPAPAQAPEAPVEEVSPQQAFDWLDGVDQRLGDLPFQVTPAALRPQPLDFRAWRCGAAQLVFALSAPEVLTVYSLVDTEPGQAGARALAARLVERHPTLRVVVPQLQRADLGGDALEQLGFARQPLHQLYMRRAV